jgi:hypothetical protein
MEELMDRWMYGRIVMITISSRFAPVMPFGCPRWRTLCCAVLSACDGDRPSGAMATRALLGQSVGAHQRMHAQSCLAVDPILPYTFPRAETSPGESVHEASAAAAQDAEAINKKRLMRLQIGLQAPAPVLLAVWINLEILQVYMQV